MYAKILLTTHRARPSLIGPLELADMVTPIIQSVSVQNITPYGNIHEHYQEAKSAARFRAEVPKNSFVNGSGEGIFMYPIIVRENAVFIPTN